MRFTLLSPEQLEELKDDFIAYLITQGIDADYWQEMKIQHVDQANNYLEDFSDLVWLKILSTKRYAQFFERDFEYHMDFGADSLNVLRVNQDANQQFVIGMNKLDYSENREDAFFKYLLSGAIINDGSKYKELILLWAESKIK